MLLARNLLDNAIKYAPAGGHIEIRLETPPEGARLLIDDDGPGIPPEELPHVKYKFYKGSSKARGSGIGLAVCRCV